MASKVFKSKRHDTAVSPRPTFTPTDELPFDLTSPGGATAMFIMRLPKDATPKFKKPCQIVGPWTVQYDPEPSDVDTIGAYDVEVEVTLANGKKLTLPTEGYLSWVIGPDLDNA